jgi:hypothetical protein
MPWYTKAPIPTARVHLAAFVLSGVGYAVGGYGSSGSTPENLNEAYNPSTNSWSTKAAMPTGRRYHAAFAIANTGYVVGGQGSTSLADNTAYDPLTNAWSAKAAMPTDRRAHAAFSISGFGYVVGGMTGVSWTAANVAYDPLTDTWSTKTSMPTARRYPAAFTIASTGYVVGGELTYGYSAANEAYNPSTDTWSAGASMPTARYALAAFALSGFGYAVGGNAGYGALSVNEAYNPSTNTWSTQPAIPTARWAPAFFAIDDVGFVAGGGGDSGIVDTLEAYTPPVLQNAAATVAGLSSSTIRLARRGVHRAILESRAACTVYSARKTKGQTQLGGYSSIFVRLPGPVFASASSTGLSILTSQLNITIPGRAAHTNRTDSIAAMVSRLCMLGSSMRGSTSANVSPSRRRFAATLVKGRAALSVQPAPPSPFLGPLAPGSRTGKRVRLGLSCPVCIVHVAPR